MLDGTRPQPLLSPRLDGLKGLRHGYFTRRGGVSDGIYGSLNIGTGSTDEPSRVAANRSRVAGWMGVADDHLLTAYQVHSPDVAVVDGPFQGERPKVDALVTARPGVAIGVSTADCGPVLFADENAGVIGAAHAGWKGALGGVLESTIDAMVGLGACRERIVAVLGPSISGPNYQVGDEFVSRFVSQDAANGRYFTPDDDGHALFDLNAYTVDRLRAAGVAAEALGRCTYGEEDLFFSYRRTTHRREPDYGRQISAIVLEDR